MYAGDESDHWHDSGPCPRCGERDCWLGCTDTDDIDGDDVGGVSR